MNAIQTREIILDEANYGLIQKYLSGHKRLPLDQTVTYTARFDGGYEMDVKCCGGGDECAWAEAVLFKDGYEVGLSDPEEEYLGLWEIQADGMTFITNVALTTGAWQEDESGGSNRWFIRAVYRKMLEMLPPSPGGHLWKCGGKIMCDTSRQAEAIAGYLNTLRREDEAVTAYYDENESRLAGYGESLVGWHSVWIA
mgnify:CR=1 FL=1